MIHEELEKEYAQFIGRQHGVACNSGTSALHLSLLALGVGPGDEVIIPDFAFAAVAFAVTYTGATPVFVDCDENYNIDPKLIRITDKTKAIIAVHTYGRLCDMDGILRVAGDIPVIEDACEAQGARVGKGTMTCFSFYKNKVLPGEEGGMVVLDDEVMAEKMRYLRNYAHAGGTYYHTKLGFNYRLATSLAELALKSLRNRNEILSRRWDILQMYCTGLGIGCGVMQSPWVYSTLDDLSSIPEARCFFKPQSTYPIYEGDPGNKALKASLNGWVINLDHTKPDSYHQDIIERCKKLKFVV